MLSNLFRSLKNNGAQKTINLIQQRFYPKPHKSSQLYIDPLKDKKGLEIGGPSPIFGSRGLLPVYAKIKSLDGCNFSTNTTWEGELKEGRGYTFYDGKDSGYQYIKEATDLSGIPDHYYDFILSSHAIEHSANPLQALSEWKRVLKPNGYLLMVTPHKDGTFDHLRPTTTLEHLIHDFDKKTDETDLTHLSEILEFHDLSRDPGVSNKDEFELRSKKNYENRCLHQHAFDTQLVFEMLSQSDFHIHKMDVSDPFHIISLCENKMKKTDNTHFTNHLIALKRNSPFPSDRN